MNNIYEPNYFAIIPSKVRYHPDLTSDEKLLYGEVVALSNRYGYCYAQNAYFAKLYNVTIKTISTRINKMVKLGILDVEIIYKENSKQVVERRLKGLIGMENTVNTPLRKKGEPPRNFEGDPLPSDVKDNNTRKNNTRKNNTRKNNTRKNNTRKNNTSINKEKSYFSDFYVNNLFIEFLQMRKEKQKAVTPTTLKKLIDKLNKYDDQVKALALNQSLELGYQGVFPENFIKKNDKQKNNEESRKRMMNL